MKVGDKFVDKRYQGDVAVIDAIGTDHLILVTQINGVACTTIWNKESFYETYTPYIESVYIEKCVPVVRNHRKVYLVAEFYDTYAEAMKYPGAIDATFVRYEGRGI